MYQLIYVCVNILYWRYVYIKCTVYDDDDDDDDDDDEGVIFSDDFGKTSQPFPLLIYLCREPSVSNSFEMCHIQGHLIKT